MHQRILAPALALLLTGTVSAQSFNLDIGDIDPVFGAGIPANTYAAAAGQPGEWNALGDFTSYGGSIVDLSGAATTITVDPIVTPAFAFDVFFDNPLTMGDDAALLDDLCDTSGGDSFTFQGLANGSYMIYTYSFATDDPTQITAITPSGESTVQVGGVDWTGMHVEGETYAVHCVEITNGTISIQGSEVVDFASINGFQFVQLSTSCPADFDESCNGDGGPQVGCTDCPCGNNAAVGTIGGCLNSDSRSARLMGSGTPSVAMDTLRFEMSGGTSISFAILSSGNAVAPGNMTNPCFGLNSGIQAATLDGLRCAVQAVQRHGTRPIDMNGDVGVTTNGWGPPNGPPGGLIAQGGFAAGQTRHYQSIYRDMPTLGCGTGQNSSQAVSVTFVP